MSSRFLFIAILIFLTRTLSANYDISAHDMMQVNYDCNHFKKLKNHSIKEMNNKKPVLIHKSKNKVKRLYFEQYQNNNGSKKQYIFVYKSGQYKGLKALVEIENNDTEVSIWIPALRKAQKLATFNKATSWYGSNFTYDEIMIANPDDAKHEILGDGTILTNVIDLNISSIKHSMPSEAKEIFKIKSTPIKRKYSYDYKVTYVDKKCFKDYKTIYFKDNVAVKIFEKGWYSTRDRKFCLHYWYAKNLIDGSESFIHIPKLSHDYDDNSSKEIFSKCKLNKDEKILTQ